MGLRLQLPSAGSVRRHLEQFAAETEVGSMDAGSHS